MVERSTGIGAILGGALGGVVGLVVGLEAHPATAWFAVFELGIPLAIVGGIAGLVFGALVVLARRCARPPRRG